MELSKRLEMVAGLVTQERIADIGTDHGYVPIYLYKQGRIKKAYACDVRKGPLEKCRKNIALYGAEDVIETRLGSGLTPLKAGEAETAIMAGMGGMLIVHILQDSPEGFDNSIASTPYFQKKGAANISICFALFCSNSLIQDNPSAFCFCWDGAAYAEPLLQSGGYVLW